MSRLLMALVVFQTVLVVVLVFKVLHLEDEVAVLGSLQSNAEQAPDSGPDQAMSGVNETDESLDERALRRIVSEEIRSAINRMPVAESQDQSEPEKPEISPAEYEVRLENAVSQLEYHMERGEISPGEMAQLQSDIARLDEESRSYVLGLLVRAISSGELDGEL